MSIDQTKPASDVSALLNKLVAALVISAVSACAPQTLRSARVDGKPALAQTREAAGLTFKAGTCGGEGGGSALVAPLVGIGVDFAINAVSAALARWKEGRSAIWHASNVLSIADPGPPPSKGKACARIFRGVLVKSADVVFDGAPIFEAEIDLEWQVSGPKQEKLALTATPFKVDYADTSAPVRGKKRKDVSILLALSGQTLQPGATPTSTPSTDKAMGILRLDLGRLEVGKGYERGLLHTVNAGTSIDNVRSVTMTGVVFETEGPNPALDAFISAWEGNKSDLGKALKAAIASDGK